LSANNKDHYDSRAFPQIDVSDKSDESQTRIVSFNIRCTDVNGEPVASRYHIVTQEILKLDADSCGLQEVTQSWKAELIKQLGDKYIFIGEARDNDINTEYSPILYKKDKYELLESGTFWISETPEVMSKGWDSACSRVCTYAKLKDIESGKVFAHLNTHLDHEGKDARKYGAKLIADFISENYSDIPVVLTGDFNASVLSAAYRENVKSGMKDARFSAEHSEHYGTYHDAKPILQPFYTIDYIFTSPDVKTVTYKTVTVGVDNRYVSDHFPVYADIIF
ncbi:MAG: endonuclease/exonuclease/phosphatase family protein, partial [Clostridia bacterium]|nr:endonuclease/exonuclease/phosphatase family protein [Clostridia bacterium]